MKREEAISLLGWLKSKTNREDDLEAIDMAIEALSEPSGDLIRRADALRELNGVCSNWEDDAKVAEIINALPSAEAVSREEYDQLEALYDAIRIYGSSADAEPSLKAIKRQIDEHWYLDQPSDEAVQGDECDHCVYKWGTKGGGDE